MSRRRWWRGCVAAVVALGVLGAAPIGPTAVDPAGAAPAVGLDPCTIAGAASGTFPAWNVAVPIGLHAAGPDGTVVFSSRGLVWRYASGALTSVAGGGATLPTTSTGPIPAEDLRLDTPMGLDVAPDGTIWATDGRTLFRIAAGVVTPEWTPAPDNGPNGPIATTLTEVHVSAAGVYVTSEKEMLGSSYYRIARVEAGVATVVAGGGWTSPSAVGAGLPPLEVQIGGRRFAVDDGGRIAIEDVIFRRLLVMDSGGTFRATPTIPSLSAITAFAMASAGTVIASDSDGQLQYQGGTWSRRSGPPTSWALDVAPDGSLVDRSATGILRGTSTTGMVTELAGWDPDRPRFTNSGRTAASAFFGRISAIQADGDDLLVAEEVPTGTADTWSSTSRIVRVRSDGAIQAVAGDGAYLAGDAPVVQPSGNAETTAIGTVTEIDVDDDGDVLFVSGRFGLGRVSPGGTLTQLTPAQTQAVSYEPTGFEELGDGRILFGRRDGELFVRAVNGTVTTWRSRGFISEPVVPLSGFHLQFSGDIETDRDGTLVFQGDYAVWRVDLVASVARRVPGLPGLDVTALEAPGPMTGIALDDVGNLFIGGHDPQYPGTWSSQSDLWRVGPNNSVSLLGRIFDYNPIHEVGDPDDFGQVGDVAVDGSGRAVLTDAESGRIRRLGGCTSVSTGVHPVVPARLLDTRNGTGVSSPGRRGPGEVVELQVTGRGGVPAGAAAATLNVTVADPVAGSYLTVWPCDQEPTVSNVNFGAGAVVPNQVNVALSASGTVCLRSPASTHLIADVQAWFGGGGDGLHSLRPARLLDTRSQGGRIPAATEVQLPVTGRGGVPSNGSTAVSLNVTVTQPASAGWLTVYPCGSPRPLASNLNFSAGQTIPNAVLARIGTGGKVCLFSSAATQVIVDVVASWDPAGGRVSFLRPERAVDTRTRWGVGAPTRVRSGQVRVLAPTGALGVPLDATSVLVNVTAINAAQGGYVTVFPCDGPVPVASTLNVVPGVVSANAAVATTAADGTVCVLSSTDVDLVLDVAAHAGS